MITLAAYLDESATDHPYVTAGWVLRSKEWNRFRKRWEAGLDATPAISYFRLNEALGLKGQFRGWPNNKMETKVTSLAKIIAEEQTMFAIGCYLNQEDFDKEKHAIGRRIYRNPYYFCMAATMVFSVYGEY